MIYKFWKTRKDIQLAIILVVVLFFHHLAAIINTYYFTLPGAEPDPMGFHFRAVKWAINGSGWIISLGPTFYEQILGIFYRFFTPSHFFGAELSVFVFLLSCFALIRIIDLLNI